MSLGPFGSAEALPVAAGVGVGALAVAGGLGKAMSKHVKLNNPAKTSSRLIGF